MADTIINTPGTNRTDDAFAAGWLVAIIVILAILVGGFFLLRRTAPAGVPNTGGGTNINVTVPGGTGSGGAGNGSSGAGGAGTGATGAGTGQ